MADYCPESCETHRMCNGDCSQNLCEAHGDASEAIACDNHAGRCVDCQRDALGCSACDETARLEVAS